MKKYKVFWKCEVILEAENPEEAINKVWVNENAYKKVSERIEDLDAEEII